MARKIPNDALLQYFSLGPSRSYQSLAERLGVSKRAIVTLATKERWQERVVEMEQKAKQGAEKRVGESLEDMVARHIKMLHVIAGKALETLKAMPLDSAIEAVRALAIVIREERALRGDGKDGADLTIEQIIRREYEQWMRPATSSAVAASQGGP